MLASPRVWAFHNVSMPIKKPVHSPKLVASSGIKAVAVSADRLERLSVPNIPKGQKPPVGMVGNGQRVKERRLIMRNVGAFLALISGLVAMAHTQFGVRFPPYSLPLIAIIACVGIGLFTWGGGWHRSQL